MDTSPLKVLAKFEDSWKLEKVLLPPPPPPHDSSDPVRHIDIKLSQLITEIFLVFVDGYFHRRSSLTSEYPKNSEEKI